MNFRCLSISAVLLSFLSFSLQAKRPHAFISNWNPGSYGNYPGAGHQKKPLPVYVRATFDQPITDDILDAYIKYLRSQVSQLSGMKNKGELAFTVLGTTSRNDVELMLEKANRHFDPDFKTPQEIAQIEAQKKIESEALKNAAAEEALKKQLEIEQHKKEAQRKEAEARKAIETAKAEVARKAFEEQKKKEEEEQRRKEIEEPKGLKHYNISLLPSDFHILGHHSINEFGEVAGYIMSNLKVARAAILCPNKTYKIFPIEGESQAIGLNEKGDVALTYIKMMPHGKSSQTVLWNFHTNHITWGPLGTPIDINNAGQILIYANNVKKIWNTDDNTISNTNHYSFLDEKGNCYSSALDVNKKGAILFSTNVGITLNENGKESVVAFQECYCPDMSLNSNNEVAAIVYNIDPIQKNTDVKIAIWEKGSIVYSKPFKYIRELKAHGAWRIRGFNHLGQILLSAPQLFLLSPKN